ncbi:MAG: class I SAM-dependent methyltransferase, partial [Candidatus Aminicenantes bacterium]|nr:class I SAM-dependent methyltransferase [Candidatus Aminicenantes bacterium]
MKSSVIFLLLSVWFYPLLAQASSSTAELDKKVQSFLDQRKGTWLRGSIPESDGKLLFDIIKKNKYTHAVEIGTSTGYSSIWIAWALSKTGGKLITIEIDKGRQQTAVANFKEAGLSGYIDARLADAHELVYQLDGPFDFVFMDADISTDYVEATANKIVKGGVFITH